MIVLLRHVDSLYVIKGELSASPLLICLNLVNLVCVPGEKPRLTHLLSVKLEVEKMKSTPPLGDRIFTAISRNSQLAGRNLRFESHEGCVRLRGEVPSYYQKQLFQETIRYLDGVERIENDLRVPCSW